MTALSLGPFKITGIVIHYGSDVHKPLCRDDQGMKPLVLYTATTDWAKVTCKSCIEWRHA